MLKFLVRKIGFVLLNDCLFFGVSFDGIIFDVRVVEVKCLWKFREKIFKEVVVSFGYVYEVEGKFILKMNFLWYI